MKARQFILFSLVLFASIQTPVSGQSLPELPHTCSIITKLPDLQNFTIKTVGPVNRDYKDLQQAIDAAQGKSMLVLDAGATFKGSFRSVSYTHLERFVVIILGIFIASLGLTLWFSSGKFAIAEEVITIQEFILFLGNLKLPLNVAPASKTSMHLPWAASIACCRSL